MSSAEIKNVSPEGLTGATLLAYNALELVKQVAEAARHDQLTGMLTKEAWKAEIQDRLESDAPFAVIFMDMDAFKKVNDTYHHERGDSILEQFGRHMRKHFRRAGDSLAHEKLFQGQDGSTDNASMGRYGGDEFGIVVDLSGGEHRSDDPEENLANSMEHLRSVIDSFVAAQPEEIRALGFDMSVGYAVRGTGENVSVSQIVQRADAAMYTDKQARQAAR